ncbi:class I adenylate-forming enzyme family protein [Nocardia exalbida]|uniref:class I adenylate-forming enzyme family protein n=1 Tax=Nocardia exalbida TaxID=290231 RepID=UPI000304FDB2|nr:AMP-binding protein [Nocardia exalbida]
MFRQSAPLFLHELVANVAAQNPDKVAVADRNGSWTYAELHSRTAEYATHIAAAGVRAGDRVLIRAIAERWVIAAIYACSRIGAMAVPLNPDLRPTQWEQINRDAEPALVMSDPLPTAGLATARKPASPGNLDPDAAALLLYTSGSTAAPKAVVCAHRSILFATSAIASRLNYRSDDVVLCRLPLSFDYGLYQTFLTALCGATLVLSGPGDDAGLLGIMRRHGVTVAPVVPSLATMLARLAVRGTAPTIRLFTNTGQELTSPQIAALRRAFPSAAVQLMYGTTECKRITIGQPNEDLALPGSVGSPLPGTSVRIVDNDARPVPPGVEGQITVAGPHLMNGYWRDEELTARIYQKDAVTGERVLHTGDYGHMDEGGNLFFHGRRDELFKHHGVRTSVAEIEAAASAVPDVDEAAVVPPRGDDEAVLFAVTVLEPSEVLRRLRDRLDPLKVPTRCRTLSRLPLGPRGKIDRTALAALVDGAEAQAAHA